MFDMLGLATAMMLGCHICQVEPGRSERWQGSRATGFYSLWFRLSDSRGLTPTSPCKHPSALSHSTQSMCVFSTAIHEFPKDYFSNKERVEGAVGLHVLCVSITWVTVEPLPVPHHLPPVWICLLVWSPADGWMNLLHVCSCYISTAIRLAWPNTQCVSCFSPAGSLHVLRSGSGLWRLLRALPREDLWGEEMLQDLPEPAPLWQQIFSFMLLFFFLFFTASSSERRCCRSNIHGSRKFRPRTLHLCHW